MAAQGRRRRRGLVSRPDRGYRDQPGLVRERQPLGQTPGHLPGQRLTGPCPVRIDYPGDNTDVYYSEGTLIGYRWFDAKNQQPLFPFGFGLSYTTFKFADLRVAKISAATW